MFTNNDFSQYNVRVENNTMTGFGQVYANSPAAMLFRGTAHCNFQGNTVSDTAYSALHYQGSHFKIHGNTFDRCVSDNTDNAAVYAVVSLVDIGNEIYDNDFSNMIWYPEFQNNGFFPKGGSDPTITQTLPPLGDDGQRLPGKTILSGIYMDNAQSGQKAYNNRFHNNQYAFIMLSGRFNSFASGTSNNEFTGGTQPYWAERVGELIARKEIATDVFEAVVHTNDEVTAKKVWDMRGANVFQRLLGNKYNDQNAMTRPESGFTGIHSMIYNNLNFSYSQWPQTVGNFTGDYVREYLTGLPSASQNSQWWGVGSWTGSNGVRLLLSQFQSNGPGTPNDPLKKGWLERGWLMLDRRTNDLSEGTGTWQVKQEKNNFFTESETNFGLVGKTLRGKVRWKAGVNKEFLLPTDSDPGDKSAHYLYVWHPDLGRALGESLIDPSSKKCIRTLLDEQGRFAVNIPSAWPEVYVKSEQSLWRKVILPSLEPGGDDPPQDTPTVYTWPSITQWQILDLMYGDMDGDNVIEITQPAGSGGAMSGSATDRDQYNARSGSQVHLTAVTQGTNRTIRHYHLHVDLNRDRKIDDNDLDILLLYSGNVIGARP